MQLNDEEKPYSLSVMEEYCKENIDKHNVDPIIREAFYEGIIGGDIAFIYLRIAQMEEGMEKISGRQIAKEVGVSPSVIVKYRKPDRFEINQKKYIQLLLKTHLKDMLDLWEKSNFNQALADYINKYRWFQVKNGDNNVVQKGDYILNNEVTKDVCRKIYREMLYERIKKSRNINVDTDWIFSVDIIKENGETNANIKCVTLGVEKVAEIKCTKGRMVHELVYKMQNIIAGLLSVKGTQSNVFLQRSNNRKVRLAMEYLALVNSRVFLL